MRQERLTSWKDLLPSVAGKAALACLLAAGLSVSDLAVNSPPALADEANGMSESESIGAASEKQALEGLGQFADYGLVGFDSVELNAHANSNIATEHLEANGHTFGTNDVAAPETSLIGSTDGELHQVTTDNGSKVVFGKAEVAEGEQPNEKTVDGGKVTANGGDRESISAGETPDFDAWREDAAQTGRALAELRDSAVYDDSDMNDRQVIPSDPAGISVVTVTAETLARHATEIHVKALEGILVLNIDAAGASELSLPAFIVNGESNRERTEWSSFNAVLNLFDSAAEDGRFRGAASFQGRVIGVVLAPFAKIIAHHNVDGQIIANQVVVNGEFHRDSYTGGEAGDDRPSTGDPDGGPTPETPEGPSEPEGPDDDPDDGGLGTESAPDGEDPETPEHSDGTTEPSVPGNPENGPDSGDPEDESVIVEKEEASDGQEPATEGRQDQDREADAEAAGEAVQASVTSAEPASAASENLPRDAAQGLPRTREAQAAVPAGIGALLALALAALARRRSRAQGA